MASIRLPSNGGGGITTAAAGRKRSRPSSSSVSGGGLLNPGRCLFHLVLLAVTFYGGIIVGIHSGALVGAKEDCSDASTGAGGASVRGGGGVGGGQQGGGGGVSDEQIESIVQKRVEVGKQWSFLAGDTRPSHCIRSFRAAWRCSF